MLDLSHVWLIANVVTMIADERNDRAIGHTALVQRFQHLSRPRDHRSKPHPSVQSRVRQQAKLYTINLPVPLFSIEMASK